MGTIVQLSTDLCPEVERLIDERHRLGLDTFDEWHQGVYVVVAGPSPEHGEIVLSLGGVLRTLARSRGLRAASPANVGTDRDDCRVPDLAVYRPDTPRTSPAFLATAELVVEVLSPGERPQAKLAFYAAAGVREYLEVDPASETLALGVRRDAGWESAECSEVLGVAVADVAAAVEWPG